MVYKLQNSIWKTKIKTTHSQHQAGTEWRWKEWATFLIPPLSLQTQCSRFPVSSYSATPWLLFGEVPKTQTTTSLECNEEEDKQIEGMWQRYSSMRNVDEPKFNWERAQCFNRQGHHVGACHKHVPRFGSKDCAEIFHKTDTFCCHHTRQ